MRRGICRGCALALVVGILGTTSPARADTAIDVGSSVSTLQPAPDDRVERRQPALGASSDLRLRILYSTETVPVDDRDINQGTYTRELVPAEELVEQARGSTDPLVLDLMVRRCRVGPNGADACDALDFARRWTEVDTGNQLAWLTLASLLRQQHDDVHAREAFIRAAGAPSWHEHDLDIARVVAKTSPDNASPQVRHAVLTNARSQAVMSGIPGSELMTLGAYCKEAGELRSACATITATIARDTDTLMGLTLVAPFAVRARIDPTVIAGYQEESDAVHWTMQFVVPAGDDGSITGDEALRLDNARLQAMVDVGERALGERVLLERHVSRSEAAARFVATLTPDEMKRRTAMLAAH